MTTMVSLLRGVNVAGHNKVKMSELTEAYQSLGFAAVCIYLQSGNVIFSHDGENVAAVSAKLEKALRQKLDLDTTIFLRSRDELRNIVEQNPFKGEKRSRLHVTFLKARPVSLPMDKLSALRDKLEEFVVKNREVYLFLPNGIGRSKLSNNFIERMLGIKATTRNRTPSRHYWVWLHKILSNVTTQSMISILRMEGEVTRIHVF